MIKILYGAPGAGKTHYVFERLREDYENSILIVPEQQTVIYERLSLEKLPPSAQLSFEVLNFSRLCNRYFRKFGGLSYNYISAGMKSLFMWRTLHTVDLEEYTAEGNEVALAPGMLATVAELKSAGVSVKNLNDAASELESGSSLQKKLHDIAKIYETYDAFVKFSFDDATDDLYKLCEIADKEKIFKGKKIYIDSFSSFTAPELAIIERMFAQSAEVTVTLGCESVNVNLICNESLKKTVQKLEEIAKSKINHDHTLSENHRTESPELRAVNSSLWSLGAITSVASEIPEDKRGDVTVLCCKNAYSEADAVVNIIKEQVAKGLRYKDIAVIARDISTVRGILDSALEDASIPYFMSRSSDLAAKPVIKLITSALRIRVLGFRSEDVLANLNTGLYNIDRRDADFFSDYVNTWSISGKEFLEDTWTMNPDGYVDRISSRGQRILNAANSVRAELIGKLEAFFIELDAADDTRGICRAIYNYFESISLQSKLYELAEAELELGRKREASDTLAVWDLMMSVLDDIVTALGDEKLSAEDFLRVFTLAIASAEIGSIPTRYDEVTLGSASLLRTDGVKCAILIGVNEDEFPRSVREEGLFSSADRKSLVSHGIPLSFDQKERTSEEFLFARRAMSSPSDSLYLLYCESNVSGKALNPSLLIRRVQKLLNYENYEKADDFDKAVKKYSSLKPSDSVSSYASAINLLPDLAGTEEAEALCELLEEKGKISTDRRVKSDTCSISSELAKKVFGDEIRLSQTAIDNYVRCAFKYYCQNVLFLRPDEKAEIKANTMGTFIHSLLEEILKIAVDKNDERLDISLPDGKTESMADEIINRLIGEICPADKRNSARMVHLFSKLRLVSLLILRNLRDEFAHSSFDPSYFELKVDTKKMGGDIEPVTYELDEKTKVHLIGKIDRVDVMKRVNEETGKEESYIRVVDYKTGSKEFSFDNVKDGTDLQLLIYLFSLCRENTSFADEIGCSAGEKPLPAAAHYLSSAVDIKKLELPMNEDDILSQTSQSFSRSGIYLDDPDIIAALNSELNKNMLGNIKLEKGILKGKGLVTKEGFDALEHELRDTVLKIVGKMRSGRADACPLSENTKIYCNFCQMSPFCRSAQKTSY